MLKTTVNYNDQCSHHVVWQILHGLSLPFKRIRRVCEGGVARCVRVAAQPLQSPPHQDILRITRGDHRC